MASTSESISFFSDVIQFTRRPVVSPPKNLTPLEKYMLIDAYSFLKQAALFPLEDLRLTFIEFLYLIEAYTIHYDRRELNVESPQFNEAMSQLDSIDKGGMPYF